MRYRVDELAARCEVSVDTVRFYQAQGLLPAPEREGRIAWYSNVHVERLERIRSLKDKGFTLASIATLLDGDADEADRALVEAVVSTTSGDSDGTMSVEELAAVTGVSTALLGAIEREGLLAPRIVDGNKLYTRSDADAVAAGLALLEAGLPLGELLDLARRHDSAMREIASEAVEMFLRFVRDPIRASASDDHAAAEELVGAFQKMLPSTSTLVAGHFRRVLLSVARERIEQEGLDVELEAVRAAERTTGS